MFDYILLALLISANVLKYWSQWLLKAKLCRRETPPQNPNLIKMLLCLKLFHVTKLDFVSAHFCLMALVLLSFSVFGETKRGESELPLEAIHFLVLPHLLLCPSGPVPITVWSGNSCWLVEETESKHSETRIAT